MVSQRDIVLVTFPFSDRSGTKVRPVLVISNDVYNAKFDDFIGIPITSNTNLRDYTISVTNKKLESGNLLVASVIKVDKITSIDQALVRKTIGKVKKQVHEDAKNMLASLLN